MTAAFCLSCSVPVRGPLDPRTEKILSVLSGAVAEDEILTAFAEIDLVTAGIRYPLKAALIIKKPSYLRLELLPIMGPPDFFLTVSQQEMKILLPGKNEFYQGRTSSGNMERFLPLAIDPVDLIAILTGTYPALPDDIAYLQYTGENDLMIEMKNRFGLFQTIAVGSNGRLNSLERRNESGKSVYSAEFANYKENCPVAGKITVNIAGGTTSFTVRYSDLKIEKAKDLSIFDLVSPAGYKKIIMD